MDNYMSNMTQLRSVTAIMRSHSVTCYLKKVKVEHLL